MKKTRVLQILYSGLGGHAAVAFSLLAADTDRQWDSSLLFVGVEPLSAAYAQKCKDLNIPFYSLQTVAAHPWLCWLGVFCALKKMRPDAIILHSINSIVSLFPVIFYCLFYRVRFIGVEHTPTNILSKIERIGSAIALCFSSKVVVLTDAYYHFYRYAYRWFRPTKKLAIISNGVDVVKYSRTQAIGSQDHYRIGMAARFTKAKRQDLLVSAMKLLVERRSDLNITLTLAGDGDCYSTIVKLVKDLNLGHVVELCGNLNEEQLLDWYQSLDLYAHASDGETLSISMLQAMSMGLPVLASDVPGINNLLHGDNEPLGILFSGNTDKEIAHAIEDICINLDRRIRLGQLARSFVIERYDQGLMFKLYNNLVCHLAN